MKGSLGPRWFSHLGPLCSPQPRDFLVRVVESCWMDPGRPIRYDPRFSFQEWTPGHPEILFPLTPRDKAETIC